MLYYTFSVSRIYAVLDIEHVARCMLYYTYSVLRHIVDVKLYCPHPTPEEVEVVEIVEVLEVYFVLVAVHSVVHVVLYLHCASPHY